MTVTLSDKEVHDFKKRCTVWAKERAFAQAKATVYDPGTNAAKVIMAIDAEMDKWEAAHPFPKLFPDA